MLVPSLFLSLTERRPIKTSRIQGRRVLGEYRLVAPGYTTFPSTGSCVKLTDSLSHAKSQRVVGKLWSETISRTQRHAAKSNRRQRVSKEGRESGRIKH